jgi:hypothetical protein
LSTCKPPSAVRFHAGIVNAKRKMQQQQHMSKHAPHNSPVYLLLRDCYSTAQASGAPTVQCCRGPQ